MKLEPHAFASCTALKEVDIPDTVITFLVVIRIDLKGRKGTLGFPHVQESTPSIFRVQGCLWCWCLADGGSVCAFVRGWAKITDFACVTLSDYNIARAFAG